MASKHTACDPSLLAQRKAAEASLLEDAHNPIQHLRLGKIHFQLGFPDLAAADAYRALTLFDSVLDSCSDYPARKRVTSTDDCMLNADSLSDEPEDDDSQSSEEYPGSFEDVAWDDFNAYIGEVYILLVESLLHCGCLRDAYDFCTQGLKLIHGEGREARNEVLSKLMTMIKRSSVDLLRRTDKNSDDQHEVQFEPVNLPTQGYARRVVYPWNTHEPDRNSPEIVSLLNEKLQVVAPKCEIRAVELPALHGLEEKTLRTESESTQREAISVQLGLFAKEDIAPGEVILRESSMLTATNRLHDDLCDACNGPLPKLDSMEPPIGCENCEDTVFCSEKCYELACETYHDAICGEEGLESIGKDIQDPKDKADYLYLLLLARTFAMAETQSIHPLDLPEVKYIWGDFHRMEDDPASSPRSIVTIQDPSKLSTPTPPPSATLPFSFQLNVLQPMRILDEMGLNPFEYLATYDTWVFNTLYAKFRGTASGRLSTWDGGPEVCAVHPLWCLANHSCDPNVRWEWGGEIAFMARSEEERATWGSEEQKEARRRSRSGNVAIKKDEEILNHYCDLELVVKERREWAMGALGGPCQCARCVWEDASTS